VLEDNQKKGGIAMKFEVAYFRRRPSAIPRAKKPKIFTSATSSGGIPQRKRNTALSRITFSAIW
jgi:hypothetical protein